MVTAGLAALISTPPGVMVMLPAVVVLMAAFCVLGDGRCRRAPPKPANGAASNAAVAAESIKRCFVKIQSSLLLAKDARGTRANP